jgi:hypothetical protein
MPTRPRRKGASDRRAPVFVALAILGALVTGPCSVTSAGRTADRDANPTLFGSNVWRGPGESRRAAAARIDGTYGPIRIARVFSEWLPPAWSALEHDLGPRPLVVSFRLPPSRILSGAADGRLTAWFEAAPVERDTFWVYHHEPEDEVERGAFKAQEFVDAWRHVARLAAAADNPRLHATLVLMCWTVNARSGRDWRSYVPQTGEVEVLAWDCYAKGNDSASYAKPIELLEPARRASTAAGASWAIAEVGAQTRPGTGRDRAAWMEDVGGYAASHGARFVTWFDAPVGGAFRLTDRPSIRAWARLVRGSSSVLPSDRQRAGEAS